MSGNQQEGISRRLNSIDEAINDIRMERLSS
jgi:hypothetical protein